MAAENRELKYAEAVREALDQCMGADPRVYVMGLGVPDPKGAFGTTLGLQEKYGPKRVLDMPTSENGMTGVAVGSALTGMRPVMVHLRMDFTLLAMDQIVNSAAKWRYMFGGRRGVPLVIRVIVGRGWGQGAQHSQDLAALFSHIPGLKVVAPAVPRDAKGLLISAVEDDDPVIFIEHRWLHNTFGPVPEEMFRVPIGKADIRSPGTDLTIVTTSLMVNESLKAARALAACGVSAEVLDVRTLKPLDTDAVLASVAKTGRLLSVDGSWRFSGFAAEILATVSENLHGALKTAPRRLTLPDLPTPSTPALANLYYPQVTDIANAALGLMGLPPKTQDELGTRREDPLDVADQHFRGPF